MPNVLYTREGEPVTVSDEEVIEGVLRGGLAFRKGTEVLIASPDGKRVGVADPQTAYRAFEKGWRFLGPDAARQYAEEKKYGTPLELLKTGVEGLARGASVNLSDPLLAGILGDDYREGAEARRRVNPGTAIGTEILGAVAPALATGGAGAGAKGLLALTPAAKVAQGAAAVQRATSGLGRVAPMALAGAAEGLAYGAGAQVSDSVLKGEPIEASKLASAAGLGGLVGGGTTGVLSMASLLAREAATGFVGKALRGKVPEELDGLAGAKEALETKAIEDPTGWFWKIWDALLGPEKRQAVGNLLDRDYRKLAQTEQGAANREAIRVADGIQETILGRLENGKRVGGLKPALDQIMSTIKPAEIADGLKGRDSAAARLEAFKKTGEARDLIRMMRENRGTYQSATQIEQLERAVKDFEKRIGVVQRRTRVPGVQTPPGIGVVERVLDDTTPTAAEVFAAIDRFKKDLAPIGKLGVSASATEEAAVREVNKLGESVMSMLENGTLFGDAAAAQQRWNKLYARLKGATKKMLNKDLGRKEGYVAGHEEWVIDPKDVQELFEKLGEPGNELRKRDVQDWLDAASEVAGALADDKELQRRLAATYGDVKGMARLSKAMADLKRIRGNTELASVAMGNWSAKAAVGGALGLAAGGPMGAIVGAAIGPNLVRGAIHVVDRALEQRTQLIRRYSRVMAGTQKLPAGRVSVPTTLKILERSYFSSEQRERPKNKEAAYKRQIADLKALSDDPERLQANITRALEPVQREHPQLAAATAALALRKVEYLLAKAPEPPRTSPLTPAWQAPAPAESEIDRWAKILRAVEDPLSVLEDLAHGRLSVEAATALRELEPELFEEMKREMIQAIEETGKSVSYEDRLQLSLFFGVPMDPTMDPSFIRTVQSTYQQAAPPTDQPLRSTKTLKSIRNAASAATRLEMRDSGGPGA